ncbi:hypothetical protein [Microseira wollei]|nr:hypothetical protein [Microseira wollei]
MPIDTIALSLSEWLSQNANIKLKGETLQMIRKTNQQLASPEPK